MALPYITLFLPAISTYEGLKVFLHGDPPLPVGFPCESAGSALCSTSSTLYLAGGSGGGGGGGGGVGPGLRRPSTNKTTGRYLRVPRTTNMFDRTAAPPQNPPHRFYRRSQHRCRNSRLVRISCDLGRMGVHGGGGAPENIPAP